MKLSVSLSEADVAFLDGYARSHEVGSRSGVVHEALALLRERELVAAYDIAFAEWDDDPDNAIWNAVTADGLSSASS